LILGIQQWSLPSTVAQHGIACPSVPAQAAERKGVERPAHARPVARRAFMPGRSNGLLGILRTPFRDLATTQRDDEPSVMALQLPPLIAR
jgi:hypothetical protein